ASVPKTRAWCCVPGRPWCCRWASASSPRWCCFDCLRYSLRSPTVSAAAASRPIGVFDSGVGGLTVVRALMERLPLENIVYFGDTARVPYGVKSVATIEHFTAQITDFLLQREVKMLIIACNTMAAVAAGL